MINQREERDFLDLLARSTRGDKEFFYNLFTDFIEKNNIKLVDPIREEQRLYDIARSMELAGYKVIHSIENCEEIQERFSKYYDKCIDTYFHFSYQFDCEEKLCLSEIYEKWDNLPPRGWIAKFCKCGNFFPISLEINEMSAEKYEILNIFNGNYRPQIVEINQIKIINFCSDNIIRIELNDGTKLKCKPYKFDTAILFGFIDDFTKLF